MDSEFIGAMRIRGIVVLSVFVLTSVIVIGGAIYLLEERKGEEGNLVILTYTSFETYGLGPKAVSLFSEMYSVNVTVRTPGDVGMVLSTLKAEKGSRGADLVIGIDNSMLYKALQNDLLEPYEPSNIGRVEPSLIFDPGLNLTPYDYGYIAIICNRPMMEEKGLPYPSSLLDLAKDVYRDQLLLLDPSMSSTGASFLIWAASIAGPSLGSYLHDLSDNSYNVFPSWDSMYMAFGSGEAPIAISYGLDTAFERIYYGTNNTVTIVPEDEGYRQIEGVGIVRGARNRDLAGKFIDFMLTDEFQSLVGLNVMLPVVPSVQMNETYREYGAFAEHHVEMDQVTISKSFDGWMGQWEEAFV